MYGYIHMNQAIDQTEKAIKFEVLIETHNGKFKTWHLWLPKSVVNRAPKMLDCDNEEFFEVDNFMLKLWDGKLPAGTKEIR